MNYLNSCICYFYYYFNITISFIRNINNYSVTHIKTRQLGSVCPNSGVTVQHVSPGLNRIAPFKYAYSLVLMSNPQHFLRNILIPWTSVNATPLLLLWLSCLSCPLVKIRCNMLGSCVSEVSKSILSCAMPSTSSGAQLLRTSVCWSSTGSSRKHGTFFTNFRVLTRTAEAALHVVWGERRDTFLLDPHAHARMDTASLGALGWFPSCADWVSFFKMLYKMLFCRLSLLQWQLLSK